MHGYKMIFLHYVDVNEICSKKIFQTLRQYNKHFKYRSYTHKILHIKT